MEDPGEAVTEPGKIAPNRNLDRSANICYAFRGMLLLLIPTILQAIHFALIPHVRNYLVHHVQIIYVIMILYAMSTLVFALLPKISMKNPTSVISGLVMVESLSAIIGVISGNYHYRVTVFALVMTILLCLLIAVAGIYCTCNKKKVKAAICTIGLLVLFIGIFVYIRQLFVTCCPVNTFYSFLALLCMCLFFFHAMQGINNMSEMEDNSERNILAVYLFSNFMAIFLLCESLFAAFFAK